MDEVPKNQGKESVAISLTQAISHLDTVIHTRHKCWGKKECVCVCVCVCVVVVVVGREGGWERADTFHQQFILLYNITL